MNKTCKKCGMEKRSLKKGMCRRCVNLHHKQYEPLRDIAISELESGESARITLRPDWYQLVMEENKKEEKRKKSIKYKLLSLIGYNK